MEKLIQLNKEAWHYKLLKFIWSINPDEEFKSLCPYFWTTILSLCVFPFVSIYRGIMWVPNKIVSVHKSYVTNKLKNKELDNFTKGKLYFLKNYGDNFNATIYKALQLDYWINRSLRDKLKIIATNYTPEEIDSWEHYFIGELSRFEEKKNEVRKRNEKVKENKRKLKKRLYKMAEITKSIFKIIITIIIIFMIMLLTDLLSNLFVWLFSFTIDWSKVLAALLSIGVGILLGFLAIYSKEWSLNEVKKWYQWPVILIYKFVNLIFVKFLWELVIVKFLYEILIYTVIFGILNGFWKGFKEFGGIFADYLDASYSDYCPGIDWENEKNKEEC